MSFDTSWDIKNYKYQQESPLRWKYRRAFLLAHKDKYPENRLIALAECFLNILLLGCSYSEPVMKLVDKLSKEIEPSLIEEDEEDEEDMSLTAEKKSTDVVDLTENNLSNATLDSFAEENTGSVEAVPGGGSSDNEGGVE